MPRHRLDPTADDLSDLDRWRRAGAQDRAEMLGCRPADRLARIAWTLGAFGPDDPETLDAIRAAKYDPPAYTWRFILAALGEPAERLNRQRWQRKLRGS